MPPDDTTRLHFAYATSEPNLDAFDVKRAVPSELLGEPAVLTVIGESHYVGVPALDFHEVCSCKPLESGVSAADSTAQTPLERGVTREFSFESDLLRVETDAEVRAIEEFPGPESADAAFRFGPDAWTTIELGAGRQSDAGASDPRASYETYHTYPEYGLAVYTLTKLHPARVALAGEATEQPRTSDDTSDDSDD
ncbi:DUF2617 family protein [Halorussus lipolyticus]|uniref:DUF2617 family protein n=1 Tax=Halorussus lipolyticus TaxID=3034024 RepID=UPI0023E78AFC|nr:DUF2617 family protein [Halorussus sp. DT80]